MKVYLIFLVLLLTTGFCYAQQKGKHTVATTKALRMGHTWKGTDPYKGKPFRPGELKTLHLSIPVGKIMIVNDITYKLLADNDGKAYSAKQIYRAYIVKVKPAGKDTSVIPRSLTEAFKYRVIDLTEKQVMSDQIVTAQMDYFFAVEDFNLDGKPDFAFTGDKAYHSFPIKNYVWVNMNGKMVYWYGISNASSDKENVATRMLSIIVTAKNGSLIPKYYNVVKDTTLVPYKGGI